MVECVMFVKLAGVVVCRASRVIMVVEATRRNPVVAAVERLEY